MPERGLGERTAVGRPGSRWLRGLGEPHPQGEAAVRLGPGPLRQGGPQRLGQRVVSGPQPLTAPLDDVVVLVVQQRGRDRLREGGAAQVGGGLGRRHPGDQAGASADPAGPQAAPVQLGQRADADQVRLPGPERGQRGRRRIVTERQLGERHVVDEQRVRMSGGEPGHPAAVAARQDQAGWVVMGRDEVDHRRVVSMDHVLQSLRVQAGAGRHPDHPSARPVQRVKHAGEGGILDGDRLARQHLAPDEQVQGLLTARRDDHLGGVGRQPEAARQVAGDGSTQRGQPVREIPARAGRRLACGPVKDGGRVGERRRYLGRAVHHGHAEVRVERGGLEQAREEAVGPVHRGRRRAVRDDAGGGPLAAFRHALVAQELIGRGHGVPAYGQGGGQVSFGGQAQARREFAGVGQAGDPGGEQAVERAVRGRPAAEQVGHGERAYASRTSHRGPNWRCHDGANHGSVGPAEATVGFVKA